MTEMIDLEKLEKSYSHPSVEAIDVLGRSGLVVVGNELAGSGKDFIITAVTKLPGSTYRRVPSRKTRQLRPGEEEGVDMVHSPIEQAVEDVKLGRYIEWKPFRGTDINGTHMVELEGAIERGERPIKDVEPRGQVDLRELNPDLRAVYPLPELDSWLDKLKSREGLAGRSLAHFVAGDLPSSEFGSTYHTKRQDIIARMKEAVHQVELVEELKLNEGRHTLFVVNQHVRPGEASRAAILSRNFFDSGFSLQHTASPICITGDQVLDYLGQVADLANGILEAA